MFNGLFFSRAWFFPCARLFFSSVVDYLSRSGARGLIKAPAGTGAGPGERSSFINFLFLFFSFSPPVGGGCQGGLALLLLDLLVLTDTVGVGFGV